MAGVNFSEGTAKQIQKAVKGYLATPTDQGSEGTRQNYGKQPVMYCKIQSDYAGGATTISAKPCRKDGTLLPNATAVDFDLSCHQVELQCYGNLMAGAVVRYNPYNGSPGGQITNPPIVATSDQYAVLQVGTASGGMSAGRVVFDWLRAH